jgi:thiol:disulfide interchange protein DsbA
MKRREFSSRLISLTAGASALVSATCALAQGEPVEGTSYVKLSQPIAMPAGGRIEVVEFFWYGCPHCSAFEPTLDVWQKKLPADVAFRRVPVVFREEPFITHQKLYYSLEAMDLVDVMQRKVFNAIQIDHAKLDKLPEILAFVGKNGVDTAKFTEAFNSFSVQTKTRQAKQLAEAYRIDGVPTLGINGRYYTSPSLAGTPEKALGVADYLIQRSRKPG